MALQRALLGSLANTLPVFFIRAEMYVVLPPGAEAMSSTRSCSWGANAITGMNDEAAWSM